MAIYALVNPATLVVNLVNWDGVTPYPVAPNSLIATAGNPNAQIGGTYAAGVFTPPVPPGAPQGILFQSVPTAAGATVLPNMANVPGGGYRKMYVALSPGAGIAGQTIQCPPAPVDGDDLYIESIGFAITNCSLAAGAAGQIFVNVPATFTLAAGVSQHVTFFAALNGWVRL